MNITPFYAAYSDLRVRLAPFRTKTDFETVKTVANIDALMSRAQSIDTGADPGGRFGQTAGHNVQNLMGRAERQPGCEQYLEIFALYWQEDGTVRVGKRLE